MAEGSNVVGLKYVAEGLDAVLASTRQYRDALQGLEQTSQRTATRTTQAGRATETAWSLAMQKYAEETRRASRAADTAWSLAMQQAATETQRAAGTIETAWSLAMQRAESETKRAASAAETAWSLAMQRSAAETKRAADAAETAWSLAMQRSTSETQRAANATETAWSLAMQRAAAETKRAADAAETAWSLAVQRAAAETKRAADAAETAWSLAVQKAAAETQRASNTIETAWSLAMQKSAAETKRAADAAETAWALAMQKAAAQTSAASEATERSAASQQRISAAYSDLLATLNPLAAAQQRYNQQVAAIQAYHQQASSSAEALKADLDALNAAYARAGSPINQFGQVTGVAGTRANTLGLVLQQTGYQVGDFAVQVQSGTNAFVAFGQQATQLAGLLYLIPGAIGVIAGTVASIGIPVVTAFLAYWDRTSEAKQGVDDLNDALKNLQSTTKNAEAELARARFGAASLEEARAMLEQEDLLRKLTAARKAYADTTQLLVENPYSLRAADVARAAVIELRALEDQARVLEEQLDKYREMEAARAKQQRDAEWLTMNQQNALDAALEWFDAQVAGQQAAYEAAEETRKAAEEGRQLAVELADSYASALGIANSNMAGAVNNAAAAAAILAQRLGVSMQTARAMSGLATMTPEQRRVAVGVRTGVIPPVALQSMGITPEQMSSLGLRGSEAGQPGAPTIFPGDPGPNTPLFRPPSTGAGSSGSGRAAVDEQAEAFERLRRSIDDTYRAQQMFTEGKAILDAQFADKNSAEYLRLLDLLKQKYPEVAGAANDFGNQLQQISNVMSRSMEDAFMSIIDGSQSAGEAFKGMARTIIAEVVKIMVIRPLVRGILGIFGLSANADGGIFSGGSRMAFANGGAFYNGNVTPFADGGVVSSPTLFPMRNGTGLMGEAGPEAIMPLKRTSSGKLGVVAEGGSGTVNQTLVFNIAANGDESVRRIVRDEAPLIAEQAKAAVLDAKRRGGAYGRAF